MVKQYDMPRAALLSEALEVFADLEVSTAHPEALAHGYEKWLFELNTLQCQNPDAGGSGGPYPVYVDLKTATKFLPAIKAVIIAELKDLGVELDQ